MQNRLFKRVLLATAAVAGLGAIASQANAAVTVTLSEPGYSPVSFTDAGTPGTAENFGSFGTYNIIGVEVAVSDKLQTPTQTQATLQITAIVEGSTGGGTLTITASDVGYTFPGILGSTELMTSSLGGTLTPVSTGDKVTFQSTATASSGVPATNVSSGIQSYTSAVTSSGANSFQDPNANNSFVRGSSFDLTNQTVITLATPYEQANISGTTTVTLVPVPEPVSGLGMVVAAGGLALGRRRRMF